MRVGPRSLRIAAFAVLAGGAVAVACGDDDPAAPVAATDAGADVTTTDGGGGGEASVIDSPFQDVAPVDSGPDYLFDAGAVIVLDGGVSCVVNGVAEVEPNDTIGTASPFPNGAIGAVASICGVLGGGADAGGDGGGGADPVEYVAFKLQTNAQKLRVQWAGSIATPTIYNTDGGVTVIDSTTFAGAKVSPYVFKVEPAAGAAGPIPWRLSLIED